MRDFDQHSPEFAADAPGMLKQIRETCPVLHSDTHGGFWLVSTYEDIARVARDDQTFASRHTGTVGGINYQGVATPPMAVVMGLIEHDQPQWGALRRALQPFFAPAAIDELRPFIREFVVEALDAVIETGDIDFVLDFANVVPAKTTLNLLGLPLEGALRFADASHRIVFTPTDHPDWPEVAEGERWIREQIRVAVIDRRQNPRDDLISALNAVHIDDAPISVDDAVAVLSTLLGGGVDTTTSLLANTVKYLDENRQDRQRLIDDPSLIRTATEEFLRYFTPAPGFSRTATTDVELGGQQIRAGDRVFMCWTSANRDPKEFDRPDDVVLDRFPNRHMAFGVGLHRCLGSYVGRAEFEIMLTEVLARIPDYRIDHERAQRYPSLGFSNGWIQMPAHFTPQPRSGG